jgi:hypothetical protein
MLTLGGGVARAGGLGSGACRGWREVPAGPAARASVSPGAGARGGGTGREGQSARGWPGAADPSFLSCFLFGTLDEE